MKIHRYIFIIILVVLSGTKAHARVDIYTIIREMTKRAIKALDLKIQRLQNKTIGLQNAQKAIENKLSELRLKEIGSWVRKQRDLFKKFYDELWKVRKAIADYRRIKQIIQRQQQIVEEYKFTWHMVRLDKHFTKEEVEFMYRVYTGIIDESIQNLETLILIINSYKLKISDAKRLEMINEVGDRIDQNYTDLQQFNNQNVMLSMNRAKDEADIEAVRKLYGLHTE